MQNTIFGLILLISTNTWAATQKAKEAGYLIHSNLSYQTQDGVIEAEREFILPVTNKSWTPLTTPKSGVVLLGKLVKAEAQTIHMEYMLIDTRKESSVISTPGVIARFGERAKISVGNDKGKVAISLVAEKTKFRSLP